MKNSLLAVLACLLCGALFAQSSERLMIKAGTEPDAIPKLYKYDAFKNGTVHFKNGGTGSSRMNYSLMLGEVHFIGSKKDTLALEGLEQVEYIEIGQDVFYYDAKAQVFYELIREYENGQLFRNSIYKFSSFQKAAAYGQYGGTSASTSVTNMQTRDGRNANFEHDQYAQYIKKSKYALKARKGDLLEANKANFLKVYHQHRNAVQNYIKKEKINFGQEEDLLKLMVFCNALD